MNEIEELLSALGYNPIESKNPYMKSWSNTLKRVNYFFKSGKFQVQRYDVAYGPGKILENPTAEELEMYL